MFSKSSNVGDKHSVAIYFSSGIEHSCMGEFRDMGIPAQVVKKKSCTSGEAASAGFFFCQ
jgi:hypothetical protein